SGAGRLTKAARVSRWAAGVPKVTEAAFARLRYRWAGCSQVKPIPPCSCTHSCAAATAASQHADLASATATGASGKSAARQAAAYLDAARAWVIVVHRSASRCLSDWNEPIVRANW